MSFLTFPLEIRRLIYKELAPESLAYPVPITEPNIPMLLACKTTREEVLPMLPNILRNVTSVTVSAATKKDMKQFMEWIAATDTREAVNLSHVKILGPDLPAELFAQPCKPIYQFRISSSEKRIISQFGLSEPGFSEYIKTFHPNGLEPGSFRQISEDCKCAARRMEMQRSESGAAFTAFSADDIYGMYRLVQA